MTQYSGVNCPFCNDQLRIQMYASECKDCQVKFLSRQTGITLASPWKTFYYTFKFVDNVYHALNIDFEKQITTIWLHNPNGDPLRQIPLTIPRIIPDVNPSNALAITKKLHQLIAFT